MTEKDVKNGRNEPAKGERVVLGEDVFEKSEDKKMLEGEPEINDESEASRDYVEVDKVITEPKGKVKPKRSLMDNLKTYLIFFVAVAAAALLANLIQALVFKSPDSLIFLGNTGFLTPPIGAVLAGFGVLTLIFGVISAVHKNSRLTGNMKAFAVAGGLFLIFIGYTTFVKYVDFRENTILDSSLFSSKGFAYLDVTEVRASYDSAKTEGRRLLYTFTLPGGRSYEVDVTKSTMDNLKLIDTKVGVTAKRVIDNYALQEIVRLGMYTEEEALKIFMMK
ncbi:hypothetical protein [Youngiibacter multivorans]|uniref:Uncharacterized protein n=1 Tax=Youngiibacter multivorans TaxID=937251 RepID=A0ABS4FZM7_9CLOT|nr:hypothetical protein [Youngiibacter multivorans]MBP1917734.1 hypothetical protein [Youngiibacter multivorans]